MARRQPADSVYDLRRLRKGPPKAPRPRLRIMIAGDPLRPIRTISLPAALPTVAVAALASLAVAAMILACGSWKVSDARAALEQKMRAMVEAADALALGATGAGSSAGRWTRGPRLDGPSGGEGGTGREDGVSIGLGRGATKVRTPSGAMGRFILQAVNNTEEMEVVLNLETGEVDADSYRRLRHLMRCLHTGAETPVDPRLIELLYRISQRTRQKIQLVSGFRAPMYSLAQLSYHTRGMAADIRLPGMTALMARDLAESMGVHGLGYYPVSGFIHVDVRDDRMRWTDYGMNRFDTERAEHGYARGEVAEQAASDPSEGNFNRDLPTVGGLPP